jgi:acyl-CoA thioesterase FadM
VQFFTAPWEVVEGDVAGCGPRLFLTGTKLLIVAWEKLVSDARLASLDASELDGISWVVLEHGLRAIAPISLREQLAVLVSTDELADSSTLRLYYRVTRVTGEPVACAFVVIACSAKATGNMVTLPAVIRDYLASHGDFRERTGSPSFIERALLLPNAAESLFPEDVRALGARVATQGRPAAVHRRTPGARLSIPALGELPVPEGRTAFFFPDAPSYDGRLLCELRAYLPYLADYFDQAEEVSRRVFRQSFLPLVDMDAIALHDQRLERCPELAHVGVMLTGVLIAESLREHDIRADALIGDGLGELTALAIAGATDLSTALKLAALRALATRSTTGSGESTSSEQFAAALADVRFESPRLPVVSLRNRPPFNRIADDRGGSLGAVTADDDLVAAAWGAGCEFVIECGPRGFLTTSVRAPGSVLRFTPTVQAEASLG